jgi:hypothetical protein
MKIIFLVLVYSQWVIASTLGYLQEITNLSHDEAKILDKKIIKQSKKLNFLKCPIKLIEHQINGPESVRKGLEYLLAFLYQSTQADPDYQNIHDNCLDTVEEYTLHKRHSEVRGREITADEIQALRKHFASENQDLVELIINNINQATLCHVNKIGISGSFFIALSLGKYEMQCYTPLGRRFSLQGPSFGMGAGFVGANITLPNSKYLENLLSEQFYIFNRAPKDSWYNANYAQNFVIGAGATILQNKDQVYDKDFRFALGFNFSHEKHYQFLSKKGEKPYYSKLVQIQLFDDMAETAYNIK